MLLLWVVINTYHNYLTIDYLYLIKYVLQTKHLGFLSLSHEKGKFNSCDRYGNLSSLNNRINFIIVNCFQQEL